MNRVVSKSTYELKPARRDFWCFRTDVYASLCKRDVFLCDPEILPRRISNARARACFCSMSGGDGRRFGFPGTRGETTSRNGMPHFRARTWIHAWGKMTSSRPGLHLDQNVSPL